MDNNGITPQPDEKTKATNLPGEQPGGLEERLRRVEEQLERLEPALHDGDDDAKSSSFWGKLFGSKKDHPQEEAPRAKATREEVTQLKNEVEQLKVDLAHDLQCLDEKNQELQGQIDVLKEQNQRLQEQIDDLNAEMRSEIAKADEDRKILHSLQGNVHSLVLNNVKERSALGDDFLQMLRAYKNLQEEIAKSLKTAVNRDEYRHWCNQNLRCALLNQALIPPQQEDDELARLLLGKIQEFTDVYHVSELYSQYEGTDVESCLICPVEDDDYNHELHESRGKLVADMSSDDSRFCIKFTWVMGLRVPADASKTLKAIVSIKEKQVAEEQLAPQEK